MGACGDKKKAPSEGGLWEGDWLLGVGGVILGETLSGVDGFVGCDMRQGILPQKHREDQIGVNAEEPVPRHSGKQVGVLGTHHWESLREGRMSPTA